MMAEYIDQEAVKEIMQKYRCSDCTNDKSLDCPLCQLHRPFAEISKMPTADVVPKSEIEKVFAEIEDLLREWFDHFRQGGDIRESCAIMVALSQVTKLKKKYTGEKEDEQIH